MLTEKRTQEPKANPETSTWENNSIVIEKYLIYHLNIFPNILK